MKVLFLDIDGVLNREGTKERVQTIFGPFIGVDVELYNKLREWLDRRPDVKVVLSSSWRADERFDGAFTAHLRGLGLSWVGETPQTFNGRGGDIGAYIQSQPQQPDITHWAILDDVDCTPLNQLLVRTDHNTGLKDSDLEALDKLLGY
jgi:HAD domain in Swiss Army Knife RNA repair proteins